MRYSSFNDLVYQIIFLLVICGALIGLFALMFAAKTKLKRMDTFSAIILKQELIVSVCSALLWGIFPVWLATLLWGGTFFAFRYLFFKIDALRLEELYRKYDNSGEYPPINHIRECKSIFFMPILKEFGDTRFRYSFLNYVFSAFSLLLLVCIGGTKVSQASVTIYYIEFLIVATAGYVFIGKFIHYIALNSPTSIFHLSPILAYIPVGIVGVIYYYICIVILRTTCVGMQL